MSTPMAVPIAGRSRSRRSAALLLSGVLLILALVGCRSTPTVTLSPTDATRIRTEVREALLAFENAERRRDTDAILGFIDPSFYMYQDGVRVDHDAVVAQIRATMPTLRAFNTRFKAVEVHALAHDSAWTSMTFHDEIVDGHGATTLMHGPTTFVWNRGADGRWRLAYADSDHYPGLGDPGLGD